MCASIDRSSPIPLYLQLGSWLEGQILDGRLSVGQKLPSEPCLASEFSLNRNTVRQAIALLVQKGLVEKHKGVGTFVRRTISLDPVHDLGRLTSFVDDFDVRDIAIQNRVLAARREPAPPDLAARFGLAPGDPLVLVERLRSVDRTPFVLERGFYPFERFGPMLELDLSGSIYELLLTRFAADLHHSVQTLRAVRPAREIAAKLGVNPTIPCIFIESLAFSADDECLEVLQSTYRGDRYQFRVESGEYRREIRPVAL